MCDKFQIYRRDRVEKDGGGVLIAISTLLPSEEIVTNEFRNIEFIATCVKLINIKIFITCSYIPPASSMDIYESHLEAIQFVVKKSKPNDMIIVLGDFNLPNVSWIRTPDSNYLNPSTDTNIQLLDSIADLGLFQVNRVANSLGKFLDLIFVDQPSDTSIHRCSPVSTPEDNYHPTLEINILVNTHLAQKTSISDEFVFDFKKADYLKLTQLLSTNNWFQHYPTNNLQPYEIDSIIIQFYDGVFNCFRQSIPMVKKTVLKGPPWNTKYLSKLKNLKNKHYKIYRRTGLTTDYSRYSVSRSIYNSTNNQCYNNYLSRIKRNFRLNPKSFYNFVNSKRRVSGYPPMMKYENNESSQDTKICDMFADFFSSSYSNKKFCKFSNYPYKITESTPIICPVLLVRYSPKNMVPMVFQATC